MSWISGLKLFNMGIDEVPKLWAPLLPQTGVAGLTGASDCGKSTLLRQLAIAIALGRDSFLGFPLNLKHGKAGYVSTEDSIHAIAASLKKQVSDENAKQLKNLHFLCDIENLFHSIESFLIDERVDLIVVDAWADTFNGNPNNSIDVRNNLNQFAQLAETYGCLFIILHHNVKNSEGNAPDKNKLNGSQAIEAKMRVLLELRKGSNDNERLLTPTKGNYLPEEVKKQSLVLKFDTGHLLFENTGNTKGLQATQSSQKYNVELWLDRIKPFRDQGMSFAEAVSALKSEHPSENVPGVTWFKEKCSAGAEAKKDSQEIAVRRNIAGELPYAA